MENEIKSSRYVFMVGLAAVLLALASQLEVRGQLMASPLDLGPSEQGDSSASLIGVPMDVDQANYLALFQPGDEGDDRADELLWRLGNLARLYRGRREQSDQLEQDQLGYPAGDDNTYRVEDVNSHLPADGRRSLSGPVNDPAEFEAAMGQLTDKLNHELPNSVNRSLALDKLLANVYSYYYTTVGGAGHGGQEESSSSSDGGQGGDGADRGVSSSELIDRIGSLLASSSQAPADEEQEQEQGRGQEGQQEGGASRTGERRVEAQQSSSGRYGASEYIDHPLALAGHQYVQGGAGEGRQLLGPEGTFENVQVVKSDHAVPSYCDPPNPCPLGYSAADGCLEQFVNSASFSREYQAKQQCSCDNEHSLFNCAVGPAATLKNQHVDSSDASQEPAGRAQQDQQDQQDQQNQQADDKDDDDDDKQDDDSSSKLNILARTIQNRFGDLESVRNLVSKQQVAESRLLSKRKDLD